MNHLKQALEESHKDLHQWFLMHQECLLLGHDAHSQCAFSVFTEILETHLHFENEYLLKHTLTGRWPLKVYVKEHDKLLQLLAKIAKRLESFYQLQGRLKRLALLEILDQENVFLHVMEHHEEREEQDLFLQLPDDKNLYQHWLHCEKALQRFADDKAMLKEFLSVS